MVELIEVEPEMIGGMWWAGHGVCEGTGDCAEGALLALACAISEDVADCLAGDWFSQEVGALWLS